MNGISRKSEVLAYSAFIGNSSFKSLTTKTFLQNISYIMWAIFLVSLHVPYVSLGYILNTKISLSLVLYLFSVWGFIFLYFPFFLKIRELNLLFIMMIFLLCVLINYLVYWSQNSYFSHFEAIKTLFLVLSNILIITVFVNKRKELNLRIYKKIYLYFVLINCFAVLIQIIFYYLFHINLFFFFQNIKWGEFIRPCGFFGEPAHFGIFLSGLLFLNKNDIKNHKKLIIISLISLLMTFSGVAYIVAVILFSKLLVKHYFNIFIKVFVVVLFLSTILILYQYFPQFQRIKSAINFSDRSTIVRTIKGVAIYSDLNFIEKILGVGAGNIMYAMQRYSKSLYYLFLTSGFSANEYLSGFFCEFINFGFIPAVLINLFILLMVIKTYHNFSIFIVFEILRLVTSINIISDWLVFLLILLITTTNNIEERSSFVRNNVILDIK